MPLDEPFPEVQFDEPVAPPTDVPVPASDNAIAARTATTGAVAQELKTSQRVDPTYPPTSRRLGEEGTVRLKVLVDERGRARDVQVAKSSGFARLDEAAMTAVRKWRFVAATDGVNADHCMDAGCGHVQVDAGGRVSPSAQLANVAHWSAGQNKNRTPMRPGSSRPFLATGP